MKKNDLELVLHHLREVKKIGDLQNYNLSTSINQNLMKVFPILEAEQKRMDTEKITINCPALMLVGANEAIHDKKSLSDFLNQKMQELVLNDYKIIDFGLWGKDGDELIAFIKYTS